MNLMSVGAKNTITNPTNAKIRDCVELLTFSLSPADVIYLNPATKTAITAMMTEKVIANCTMLDRKSVRLSKLV